MKRLAIILAALAFGTATAAAQTQNVTADGKATTTKASNGTWNLRVDGKLIAVGLASAPTGGTDGIFIVEKPKGTKYPIDRTGKRMETQRITGEQLYNSTLNRIEASGGVIIDEDRAVARAEALRAENARLAAIEKERFDARMAQVNAKIITTTNEKQQLWICGRKVMEAAKITPLYAYTSLKRRNFGGGGFEGTEFAPRFRIPGYDRYWFYVVDKGPGEGYSVNRGLIVVDAETGAYELLLPFIYATIEAGSMNTMYCSSWVDRVGRDNASSSYIIDGSTKLEFRKK